jgi:hypothetical protein
MYKYKVKQTEKRTYFFSLIKRDVINVYQFNTYNEALIFCLSEEISKFTCIVSDKVQTTRKTYKNHYTLNQFKKHCVNNPMHFLNTQNCRLNDKEIANYYFYLIGSNKLTKLKKY